MYGVDNFFFTIKSLIRDLDGATEPILKDLYTLIWKDAYPKKKKSLRAKSRCHQYNRSFLAKNVLYSSFPFLVRYVSQKC